jgi:hypothetical protein
MKSWHLNLSFLNIAYLSTAKYDISKEIKVLKQLSLRQKDAKITDSVVPDRV